MSELSPVNSSRQGAATTTPIACTLAATEVARRLARWQRLAAHVSDRTETDDGIRVRFDDTVSAAEIAGLAAEEHACCAFFTFTIYIATAGTTLEVGAPDDARALVGLLLGQDDREESGPAITTT
jgi:hypothetical protein